MRAFALTVAAISAFCGVSVADHHISQETKTRSIQVPSVGQEASCGPGEAMYSESTEKTTTTFAEVVEIQKSVMLRSGFKKFEIPAGSKLTRWHLTDAPGGGAWMWCYPQFTEVKTTVFSGRIYDRAACFQERARALTPYFFKGYRDPEPALRIPFETGKAKTGTTTEPGPTNQLLYQGSGGGVLRLMYREFTDDRLARPAFTQEVSYDLADEGPTEVVFKGARISVLSADNLGIRYVVRSPFSH